MQRVRIAQAAFARAATVDEGRLLRLAGQVETFTTRQAVGLIQRARAIEVGAVSPQTAQLVAWAEENAVLIRSLDQRFFDDVARVVAEAPEDLTAALDERFGVAQNRSRVVGRNEVGTLNGRITQARNQEFGVEEYRWRTRRDELVRPNHKSKEGEVFRWDSPPPDTGHPGDDINCRCGAEPV